MYYSQPVPIVNRSLGESSKMIFDNAQTAKRNTIHEETLLAAKPPLQKQGQIAYDPNARMRPDPYRIEYFGYGKKRKRRKRRQGGRGAVVDKWGQYLYVPQPIQMQYV